jgi:DNA mismatch repair protein MutS
MALSPMMQQYFQVKEKHEDCILFFRLGDFYEMFFSDAETASKELELVLTGRVCGLEEKAPMCGIPYHAANNYISRLISKGYKVAICEQLEDASLTKGIVKRDVVKIITPGTYTDPTFLEEGKNNFIMSLYINDKDNAISLCFTDISTGEFFCTDSEYNLTIVMDEISKFNPKEIILQNNKQNKIIPYIEERFSVSFTCRDDNYFTKDATFNIENQFANLEEDSINEVLSYAINGLLNYILETQKISLSNITELDHYNIVDYLTIDINSRRNLELVENIREKTKKGSLLWILDKTNTAMGSRQLRKWIEQPLINRESIENRLCAVEELVNSQSFQGDLKEVLKKIYDIERIVGKISSKGVNARELLSLKNSISTLPSIKNTLKNSSSSLLMDIYQNIDELKDIFEILEASIIDNPSVSLKEGNIIKTGYNSSIDELRDIKLHGKEWIAALECSEREATGIKSLKVSYNRVFGYYIEITNSNISSVPEGRYIRKQTLSNAERYITSELKVMEDKILGAEEKLINIEYELFTEIRNTIETHIDRMKRVSKLIAELDCICSLSEIALENHYCKPTINDNGSISITEGRHAVVEKMIPRGAFITNSTLINNKDEQLILITGPNMAGKSTYMRQVALITIMAQIGSFVPAEAANLCICDKVFTRIGASDDLASGKSTFMVEMWEVSNILKNATNKSLILLDEVGRGTSTYDGLSIAWSVIEYICNTKKLKSKTLFATHYHELTKLEGIVPGVKNYSVAVKEIGNEIVFLRKIVPGGADQSYGIEVAKLAGLPMKVINRSKEILQSLEKVPLSFEHVNEKLKEVAASKDDLMQLDFSDIERNNIIREIATFDILNMTPMESMSKLYEIINKAKAL